MKNLLVTATALLLIMTMLTGCSKSPTELPAGTEPSGVVTTPAESPAEEPVGV